ncbi:DUF2207 domain-containing protein [Carnobacterium gallinarum]|uniref:DUF2207 domain-containing protein n=1 Tax=Carnobacterium gallinarum TaxID=2749 RepID=UPI00054DFA72|nr:DUF2207 domain-containing protein [Carnobacterium gallinarum]
MKKYLVSLLVLVLGMIIFKVPIAFAAGDYVIDDYKANVDLQEDGSGRFQEAITYDFDGDFNGVFYNLDLKGIKDVTNLEVSIKDATGKESKPFSENNSGKTGSYQLTREGNYLKIKVFQKANNEKKTVVYRYTIPDVVTNYADTAEFNRRIIGAGWEDVLRNISVTIKLPKKVEDGKLRAWAHGSLNGKISLEDNQKVLLTMDSNPSNTFVEARLVFPISITQNNSNIKSEKRLAKIMAAEKVEAEKANQRRQNAMWFAIVLTVVFAVVAIWGSYHGRKVAAKNLFKELHIPEHLYDIPEDITPAVMYSATKHKKPRTVEITSTLMDLVRKKQLTLKEIEMSLTTTLGKTKSKTTYLIQKIKNPKEIILLTHEAYLIKWLIDDIGNGESVTLNEIENFGKKDQKKAKKFMKNYQKWQDMVKISADQKGYYSQTDQKAKNFVLFYHGVLLALFVCGNIAMNIMNGVYPWAIVAMFILLIMSGVQWIGFFPIRTLKGETAVREWEAFKSMLQDVSNLKMADVGSLVLWDHFLVYAISLDVSTEVINALALQFPQEELTTMYVGSYYLYNPFFGTNLGSSISTSFESSFNNAMGSAVSNASSTDGTGGGFSGGSSGGFGGGSGGGAF